MSQPILDVIVLLPLGGAAVAAALPGSVAAKVAKPLALGVGALELAIVLGMVIAFKTGNANAGFQFTSHQSWFGPLGVSWDLGVDGISVFLVAMTALLFPVALAAPYPGRSPRSYAAWMLLLESACMATFLSTDAFLFFVAFEVTLVPGYFVIVEGGGPRRGYAATKFFLYTFAGSAFLFVGILATYFLVASHQSGTTFSIISLAKGAAKLPVADQSLLIAAFGIAFAVKMPLVPFHTWMPDAYTQAPTGGSMVLSGILFKLGTYGILRWGIFLFPKGAVELAPLGLTLAAIGIIWGSVVAAVQKDLKRLVAYGTVAGVGSIIIGLFGFTVQGITGGIVQMVNHGLSTGALFLLVGMVWERRKTYQLTELRGLQTVAPILGWVFMAVIMSEVGLPGLNGFIGEFLVLVGTFLTHRWWAVVAVSGVVLGAVYLLWAYQRVFNGPAQAINAGVRDMSWAERATVAPLLAGIIFIGVYPQPLLERVEPAVNHLVAHLEYADPHLAIPKQGKGQGQYAVPKDQVVDPAPSTKPKAGSGTSTSGSGAS